MCCENTPYDFNDIDGKCPDCGEPTVDGRSYDQCAWSPVACKICGDAPCDGSC